MLVIYSHLNHQKYFKSHIKSFEVSLTLIMMLNMFRKLCKYKDSIL